MSTITLQMHVYARRKWDGTPEYYISDNPSLSDASVFGRVCTSAPFTFEPPSDLNLTAIEIDGLEAEKTKALANYQSTVANINERLSKLMAICNEVTA